MARKDLLKVEDLRVTFASAQTGGSEVKAVDGISFEVPEGAFVSLVGESGSGKSVTALSLCRLENAHTISGSVRFESGGFEGMDLITLTPDERRRLRGRWISYIFQDPFTSLNPVVRVGAQVEEAYRQHFPQDARSSRTLALQMLERVRITDPERVYTSYPHELSGGMRQRVLIAASLMVRPKLLVADEPTTALDATTESEILSLLVQVQREEGLSILFITHDLDLALRHSARLYVMQQGRIVERLDPHAGTVRPEHPYAQKLFRAREGMKVPKSMIAL